MADDPNRERILTVGASNMDNFGDLLFPLITEKYLPDFDIVHAAPFSWGTTDHLLERNVHTYGRLLEEQKFDAVWTTGGQIGGVSLDTAFRMSAPPGAYVGYESTSSIERSKMLRHYAGSTPIVSAFIPSTRLYPRNRSAVTVINSVGLANIFEEDFPECRRQEQIALLREASIVSTRDKESSQGLDQFGIEHRLAPDLVHALSRINLGSSTESCSDVILFQLKSIHMAALGPRNVADALIQCDFLRNFRIRIFLAGTFRAGGDSMELSNELVKHVRNGRRDIDIDIIHERHPVALVRNIRQARVVIGDSLHLRIAACAFSVPRVSVPKPKVSRYAQFWDPVMPYDVALEDLDAAVRRALSDRCRRGDSTRSSELSQLAHDNIEYLAQSVREMIASESMGVKE